MKRILCFILPLLILTGCALQKNEVQDPVSFYYLRAEVSYDDASGIISSETAEATGRIGDLRYLLTLYLAGPSNDQLRSPYPKNVALIDISVTHPAMTLTLEGAFDAMEDLEISKACACLALTCFGMTDCQTVSIHLLDREENSTKTIEITRDSLILEDLIPETT